MERDKNLPLTETTYYILLVLTQPLHGYGAIQEIARISQGTGQGGCGNHVWGD